MLNLLFFFFGVLEKHRFRQWLWLTVFVVIGAFVELAALGLLAMFITSLTSLDQVMASRYVGYAKQVLGDQWLSEPNNFYLALGLAAFGMVVLKNVLASLLQYATARFEGGMNMDAGVKMLKGFMAAPYPWSSTQNPSDVQTAIQWRLYVGIFPGHLITLLSDAVITLLLCASLFYFEPLVSLCVIVILGGAGGGIFLLFKSKIALHGFRVSDLLIMSSRESLRNILGLREMKAFNATEDSCSLFKEHLDDCARSLALQKVFERATVWCLESVGFGGVLLGSLIMLFSSEFSSARMMGALSLLAISAWRILPSIYRSIAVLGAIRGYTPLLQKVRTFLVDLEKFRQQRGEVEPVALPCLSDCIHLKELDYSYGTDAPKVLADINIHIAKGEMVGIIGHSGAGKSTLADVLTGFLEPTSGSIMVDGRELDASSERSWRDQLGLVPQSPYFFDGTLAENIALTLSPEAIDHDRIRESCSLAGIDDFIKDLPKGLDSPIGERGNLLSGGQGQRVAIARALYKNPQVLIFDEATSSLDDKNEKIVRETILGLKGKRTIVIIAHRLRAVEDCDKLVWLEHGSIVDCGAPESILSRYVENEVPGKADGSGGCLVT